MPGGEAGHLLPMLPVPHEDHQIVGAGGNPAALKFKILTKVNPLGMVKKNKIK